MIYNELNRLELTECQRQKCALILMDTPLAVGARIRSPLQQAKFIKQFAEDPTLEIGGLKKSYNCTLPVEALKILIADLIQYCEEKKVDEWHLDDLRTYAAEEIFGRQAEPGHMAKADKILSEAGYLDKVDAGYKWNDAKIYPIVAMAEALIEKFSLKISARHLSDELAHRYGKTIPQSTFSSARNANDFETKKQEFLDRLS